MAKSKKKVPALNSSSMADISFLLLIFFLVTSSMDTDSGWQDVCRHHLKMNKIFKKWKFNEEI
jgi:biopolymer transport protein ExbD